MERQAYSSGSVDLSRYSAALLSVAQAIEPGDACIAATRICEELSDSGRAAVALREGPVSWHLIAGRNIGDLPAHLAAPEDGDPRPFRAGEIVRIADVPEYAKTHPLAQGLAAAGIRSFIAAALQYGDHDGYLAVYNQAARHYTNEEVTLLSVVALQLSLALTKNTESQLLHKTAEAVPQLVWTSDASGAMDYSNKRWFDYTGLNVQKSAGWGWQKALHPNDRQRALNLWKAAMGRGDHFETEYRLRRGSDHSFRWFLARALPLKDPSGFVVKWFGTCTDIDDQKRANDSMQFLLEVSEALASSSDTEVALQALAQLAVPRIADLCAVYLTRQGGLFRAALAHDDSTEQKIAEDIVDNHPFLTTEYLNEALQSETPLLIENINESLLKQHLADTRQLEAVRKLRARSAMLLPLRARGRNYGAVAYISGKSGRVFGQADLTLAKLVAKRAAVAVDNARLLAQERQSTQRLQFLADATKALTASLDLHTTLETLINITVPGVADWAGITLLQQDGAFQITTLKHKDSAHADVVARLQGLRMDPPAASLGTAGVVRSGRTEIYQGLVAEDIPKLVEPALLPALERLGYDSIAVIPLRSRGRVLGALSAAWIGPKRGRSLDLNDIPVLEELAARAASAIEHAQLYERQHHVADTLQRAFLPASFPDFPGIRFDAVYASGHVESEIGGDWYDAFELRDGRIFVSVGDVAGRGLPAAVTMGKMRQALRSFALDHTDLVELLSAANSSLRLENPDTMVTVFVGIIDRDTQTLNYAIAGHPPPFMRLANGAIDELQGGGLPLGIRTYLRVSAQTIPFPLDAMLVCYTDGLTENTRDIFEGEECLRRALADPVVVGSSHPAEALMKAVVASDHQDDVAVLTVSMRHTFPGALSLTLPAVASSAQKVRHALRAFMRDLDVMDDKDFEIQVAVGEAVNNVIEHAYGAAEGNIWINAHSKERKLTVEIADRGNWRRPRQDHGGRGLRIIENLCETLVLHSGKDRSFVRLTFDLAH